MIATKNHNQGVTVTLLIFASVVSLVVLPETVLRLIPVPDEYQCVEVAVEALPPLGVDVVTSVNLQALEKVPKGTVTLSRPL